MNFPKIIIGGLLAGLVMNVIDFIVNVPMLGAQWESTTKALHLMTEPSESAGAIGWITVDFLCGIALVWLYASIRPRYGAGPKTAMIAGLAVWFITRLTFSSYVFGGIYPMSLIGGSSVGALVASLAGGVIGCWVYSEKAAA